MEQLQRSYGQASLYPANLVHSEVPAFDRKITQSELQSQAERLFCADESSAGVDFLIRSVEGKGKSEILPTEMFRG
jgi:hypothetical protein